MIEFLLEVDRELFYLVNGFRASFLDKILPHFSKEEVLYGFFIIVSLLLFLRALYQRRIKGFLVLFFLLLFGYPVTDFTCGKIFKPLANRERPFAELPYVYYYTKGEFKYLKEPKDERNTLGFPSCHAANSGYGGLLLSFAYPKGAPIFISFFLLVGYSRIYLGHHYPLDVLGGYLIGLFWAFLGIKFWKFSLRRINVQSL